MKIDLVVPYVDSTDPVWQKIFFNAKLKAGHNIGEAGDTSRFRSQGDFFRYFFRSIEKNMPWINNVFLIVQSNSQIPVWLDTSKVKIVLHDQFIPKKYLPTFNSGTIEMFLQNIPELSEYFIYANDDIYALKGLSVDNFFSNNKCVFNYLWDSDISKNDWRKMCQNNYDLIYGTNKAIPYARLDHEFRPYIKSKMQECYKTYKNQIEKSISAFREPKNLTVYLYSLYLLKNNLQKNSPLKIGYLCSKSDSNTLTYNFSTKDTICLNDTSNTINIYTNKVIRSFFWSQFSSKSKYELYDTNNLKEILKKIDNKKADGRPDTYLYF